MGNLKQKYLTADQKEFINEKGISNNEKEARKMAIKFELMGVTKKNVREAITQTAKNSLSERRRTNDKTKKRYYKEMYEHKTPFNTVFNYIVQNKNYFYVRMLKHFKENKNDTELHRMEENYSAESVFPLTEAEHTNFHSMQIKISYYDNENRLTNQVFKTKKEFKSYFKISEQKADEVIAEGSFNHEGMVIKVKHIPKVIEPDIEFWMNQEIENVKMFERHLLNTVNERQIEAIKSSINESRRNIKEYERMIKENEAHNERMKKFKAKDVDSLWNETDAILVKEFNEQLKKLKELVIDELKQSEHNEMRIEMIELFKITKDKHRLNELFKAIKNVEFEEEDYCYYVKLKNEK